MKLAVRSPLRPGRECYLHANGRAYVVEILGTARDTIWVSFPAAETLPEGTGVDLEAYDGEHQMRYHACVAVRPDQPGFGLVLARTESVASRQRRREWRVPTDLPIWLRPPGDREKQVKGRMLDIALNGCLVKSSAVHAPGEVVEMVFQLPESAAHRVTAQVVYGDMLVENGLNRYGLRLLDVNKRAREAITWFLYGQIQQLYTDDLRNLYPEATSRQAVARREAQPA